ncbi:hypothetical protein [Methylobacterium durans]|uniref:Exopolysaccharide production protein YjbE n=2 Tax=Methylobacterium durans TaxID=2202825 RepID=A0A2U8W7B5_9HYPH|nr:hypothetical protein [Methylobacterium durans]AWN41987.1 hypothetical protein DK389_17675 [Methylobacterium durans]
MRTVTTIAGALLLMSSAAMAAPCSTGTTVGNQAKQDKSSNVDPGSTSKVSPGAKAESPGTVGAMNNAGSTTATSAADVKRESEGKPTAQQQASKDDC